MTHEWGLDNRQPVTRMTAMSESKPPRQTLVYGPQVHTQRCVRGAHVAGGQCSHTGGIVNNGSCYVRVGRVLLVAREHVDGTYSYHYAPCIGG